MTKMDSNDLSIRGAIKNSRHTIPTYQRRYAWTESNIQDYWEDIVNRPMGHFLGSMVVAGDKDGDKEVVDGQQRLTTSIIALCAIRDHLDSLDQDCLAAGIHDNYIYYQDDQGKRQVKLVNLDADVQKRLEENIFSRKKNRKCVTDESKFKVLEIAAYESFDRLISKHIERKATDTDRVASLEDLRDRVLGSEIVYVTVTERRDAFQIFETLNDRGKSLEALDLVKNFLFQTIDDTQDEQHLSAWAEMMNSIEQSHLKFTKDADFLYYAWNSFASDPTNTSNFIKTERILRSVIDYVESKDFSENSARAREIVDYLHSSATLIDLFGQILIFSGKPEAFRRYDAKFSKGKYEKISRSLYGILVTEAKQPITLLLALFHAHRSKSNIVTKRTLEKFLDEILIFQFRWSISSQSSTEAQRRPYRAAAAALASAKTANDVQDALQAFKATTGKRAVTKKQFEDGLASLKASNSQRGDYFKILYILQEINRNSKKPVLWPESPTIEHIEGQGKKSGKTPRNSWVFKMGNMLVLPSDVNSKLPEPFSEKADQLTPFISEEDKVLREKISEKSWNAKAAGERLKWLQQQASQVWPCPR